MTITYSLDVANTRFCGFAKLLGRWKGSIYKILWKEFIVFIAGYSALSITYRCLLNPGQQKTFEAVVIYFESFIDLIPLSFVLGFYVSLVIGRWWEQFDAIPFPDRLCYMIATYVHGSDERSRIIRRTLGRYLILMQAFTFQSVSTAVKKRFPTSCHFVAAGIMTKEERTVYENVEAPYGKWWLPAQWFCAVAMRAKKEGRIKDSILLTGLIEEFALYRNACGKMFSYDWISVPLVYTQVVTLAVYTYSLALMVGRQYLNPDLKYRKHEVDLYVPIFTLLQFFFYVGWLKVAEQIVNPYGEDDDDFELNWCLDRSCHVVYLLVDHFHTKHPRLRRDAFWDEILPQLPQTKITAKNISNPQLGSAFNMEVNPADSEFLPMDKILEEDCDANIYTSVSAKESSRVNYRPSFLMSIFNSSMAQSLRKKSVYKSESFREGQGHVNPAFAVNMEKFGSPKSFSPATSRRSSLAKRNSPTHSRASSVSFHPSSISRHRHKSFDIQNMENNLRNGSIPECDSPSIANAITAGIAPVVANFEDGMSSANSAIESEAGLQKMDRNMPPIPEEPSRAACTAILEPESMESNDFSSKKRPSNVQMLVAEASKVLEELNKAVAAGEHGKECESKGYESCCSLDSDDSDENNISYPSDLYMHDASAPALLEMSNADGNDTERIWTDQSKC